MKQWRKMSIKIKIKQEHKKILHKNILVCALTHKRYAKAAADVP